MIHNHEVGGSDPPLATFFFDTQFDTHLILNGRFPKKISLALTI